MHRFILIHRYIHAVKKSIRCSVPIKEKIAAQIRCDISDYLEENPEATMDCLYLHFGKPEDYGRETLPLMNYSRIKQQISPKKRSFIVIAVASMVCLLILSAVAVFIAKAQNAAYGYAIVEIHD